MMEMETRNGFFRVLETTTKKAGLELFSNQNSNTIKNLYILIQTKYV